MWTHRNLNLPLLTAVTMLHPTGIRPIFRWMLRSLSHLQKPSRLECKHRPRLLKAFSKSPRTTLESKGSLKSYNFFLLEWFALYVDWWDSHPWLYQALAVPPPCYLEGWFDNQIWGIVLGTLDSEILHRAKVWPSYPTNHHVSRITTLVECKGRFFEVVSYD
jgi:hypothetical protein